MRYANRAPDTFAARSLSIHPWISAISTWFLGGKENSGMTIDALRLQFHGYLYLLSENPSARHQAQDRQFCQEDAS
jgi:hypothetical protein